MSSFTVVSQSAGATEYVVVEGRSPRADELSWNGDQCDAFVLLQDHGVLPEDFAVELAEGLVRLPVDWIETLGLRSEYLHDLIDQASVSMGRQARSGDGNPMTAWHESLSNIDEMVAYILLGGLGASERKIVIVIGPEGSSDVVAKGLGQAP